MDATTQFASLFKAGSSSLDSLSLEFGADDTTGAPLVVASLPEFTP